MKASFLALALAAAAFAQRDGWARPFPAHTIAGNLHYVGTEDLACFLITTPDGHILINTGLADSVPLIRSGIEKLGFRFQDIKILLTMQAHYDHTAALAAIQKQTGAKMFATEADAPALEDGGKSDPSLSAPAFWFDPVRVDRRLKDGDKIRLGSTELTTHLTPGHTRGSVSYSLAVDHAGKRWNTLIVNMNTVVMPLVGNAKYPGIAADYVRAFKTQKALKPDIWVAAHASQYGMQEKLKKGSFADPEGYAAAVAQYEKLFEQRLAQESRR